MGYSVKHLYMLAYKDHNFLNSVPFVGGKPWTREMKRVGMVGMVLDGWMGFPATRLEFH